MQETTQSRSQARRIAVQRGRAAPTFTGTALATTPDTIDAVPELASSEHEAAAKAAQAAAEKQKYGPYPATNRHERRKAAKLMRQDAKRMHVH
jgi:hypothetical protein